jgi:hypothetical protein
MSLPPADPIKAPVPAACAPLVSELLVLPDGRVLVHNLTPSFAALLRELNPQDAQLEPRCPTATSPVRGVSPYECSPGD